MLDFYISVMEFGMVDLLNTNDLKSSIVKNGI